MDQKCYIIYERYTTYKRQTGATEIRKIKHNSFWKKICRKHEGVIRKRSLKKDRLKTWALQNKLSSNSLVVEEQQPSVSKCCSKYKIPDNLSSVKINETYFFIAMTEQMRAKAIEMTPRTEARSLQYFDNQSFIEKNPQQSHIIFISCFQRNTFLYD